MGRLPINTMPPKKEIRNNVQVQFCEGANGIRYSLCDVDFIMFCYPLQCFPTTFVPVRFIRMRKQIQDRKTAVKWNSEQ
jgi:hypothetical protein